MTQAPRAVSGHGSGYIPAIDGLRAVAVLAVVFFHAGFATIGGGYVGVDVFFVISGFLITRLILSETARSGRFDFGRFYLRRIRRLFPAALTTVAVSFVFAALLFAPEALFRFAASAVAALLSLSNFLFWVEADYFDAEALTKPLLHTWSLSVEEQFYLLWPTLLVFGLPRLPARLRPVFLLGLCAASLVLAEIWIPRDASGAFYLLPTRILELGIGGLLVWAVRWQPRSGLVGDAMVVLGLGLIGFACLVFTATTPFPGFAALVPCIGAALVLHSIEAAPRARRLLDNRSAVWIGRISYSLYLVHWPLLVFAGAWLARDIGSSERWVLIGAAIGLAALQFALVEQRFRYAAPDKTRRFLGGAAATLAIGLVAGSVILSDGWPSRIPSDRYHPTNWAQRDIEFHAYCDRPDPAKPVDLFPCQNDRGKPKDIVLWGDSHALHLVDGFSEWFTDYNIHVMELPGCSPQSGFAGYVQRENWWACVNHNRAKLAYLLESPPTNVVITGFRQDDPAVVAAATTEIMTQLEAAGHTVAFLGNVVAPKARLQNCISVPRFLLSDEKLATHCQASAEAVAQQLDYDAKLESIMGDRVISMSKVQCEAGDCRFFLDDGMLLFRDSSHVNAVGSIFFVGAIRDRLPFRAEGTAGPRALAAGTLPRRE